MEFDKQVHGKPHDEKEDSKTINKLYNFCEKNIPEKRIDASDSYGVYGFFKINNHIETRSVTSYHANSWLKYSYYDVSGEIVSSELCLNALQLLAGKAGYDGTKPANVFNRIAMKDDCIFYDLCWPDWKIAKIDSNGYKIIDTHIDTPIFARKQHQLSQVKPVPVDFDALEKLCEWLRIKGDDKFIFKIHLVSLFIEKYPMPIMVFTGEQGSIKTTLTGTVKTIVDPSNQEHLEIPDKSDDMIIQIFNRYLSAFDNITSFDYKISDRFCRVVTGLGVSKRQLYKDLDEVILTLKRKIILNGIAPSLDYPDLRDRCIFYETTPINEDKRLTLEEFNNAIEKIKPGIIDQIFTILSKAIKGYYKAKNDLDGKMQRMSDFSVWGEAIARAMGAEPMSFIQVYKERLIHESLDIINSYPIFPLIQTMMKSRSEPYEDSVSNFHHLISTLADNEGVDVKSRYSKFPKAPNKVSQQMKILRPVFRKLGIEINFTKWTINEPKYTKGTAIIKISNSSDSQVKVSSLSSYPHQEDDSRLETPKISEGLSTRDTHQTTPDLGTKQGGGEDNKHSEHGFTSKSQESDYYATPGDLFATICQLHNVNPHIDVCANAENTKCTTFYGETIDGLKQNWRQDFWCNPPYSKPGPWVMNCYAEHVKHNVTGTALLRLDRTTAYWRDFVKNKAEIHELNRRVKFIDPKTNKSAENSGCFESVIVIWRAKK